jgi:predicted transcriptional regulator
MNKFEDLTIIIGGNHEEDLRRIFSKGCDLSKEPKNTLYLNSFEQLHELLSPKKMDLLKYLIEYNPKCPASSVSDLAKKTNRKQEAISRDLIQLRKLGLIKEKKEKQSVLVSAPFRKLIIEVR